MSADLTSTERTSETQAVPDVERGGVHEARDAVTWLLCGTDTLHALPRLRRGVKHDTLGSSPGQDVVVPGPYVSAEHCRLVRTPLGLRVVDRGSRNGTYFEGRRKRSFYLDAGQSFTVGARATACSRSTMRCTRTIVRWPRSWATKTSASYRARPRRPAS